jgi:ectoine hydroxylase
VFNLLARHPRLVEPLRSGSAKWARDDGMPKPRAMNIAVFLDAVMAINGPLFLIRKSHRTDVLNAGHDKLITS